VEGFHKRLKRYLSDDLEIFGWMTIMMQNGEVTKAMQSELYQCVVLSTHSIIQTIAQNLFGLTGLDGTRFYLENFLDEGLADRKFSTIAEEIHELRNVIAHLGYSSLQHEVEIDNEIAEGWRRDEDVIKINLAIYCQLFDEAFRQGRHIKTYKQLPKIERTKRQYSFIRKWLRLDKGSHLVREINKLEAMNDEAEFEAQESSIKKMLNKEYDLDGESAANKAEE
jgi:hypothetical protein